MNDPLFIGDVGDLVRVLIAAPILYGAVILFVRIAGKRSTSQMNNFDWVVTVAMGSLLASGLMLEDVTISESLVGIVSLLGLQWALTKTIYHWPSVGVLVKAEPALLVSEGEFLTDALCRERISRDEIVAAIRERGLSAVEDVRWVILETDASMSVIPRSNEQQGTSAVDKVVSGSARDD